ncbi:ankyrin repeat domain-containing protein [Actinomadura atramentaria]|uniref:ankyrin repeat domain-containing protein n=1 Tax=Actinomadura atramentaria TaxID=1990 RepID=UPI000363B86F|nr:ankyrin repeat domain-containing protein [Actinomadura atramentaria]
MAELDRVGRDVLHYAALEDDVPRLRERLAAGVDPSLPDRAGWTPLHFAAQDGSVEAVTALLAAGAQVDAVNERGQTPLWLAVMNSGSAPDGAIVRLLLAHGADRDHQSVDGISPLELAQNLAGFPVAWLTDGGKT